MSKKLPKHYMNIRERFPEYGDALSKLGESVRNAGPLDEKSVQLIQLAAAAAIRSEGGVHSHARRAIENGATEEEVYQAVILLTSTIGFPNVAAAISWVNDIVEK
ncbi:MAG TPA: carboxymuconolactone decarboxylase family protein [Methanobacterium sp.]|nr:carboxymuconolactone decarboxylase family protein [Methanobacterium sp.]